VGRTLGVHSNKRKGTDAGAADTRLQAVGVASESARPAR
jgi:hypothetical protein